MKPFSRAQLEAWLRLAVDAGDDASVDRIAAQMDYLDHLDRVAAVRRLEPLNEVQQGIDPLVDLLAELRPDVGRPVLVSLVCSALDDSADVILDEAWSNQRQLLYSSAIRVAHSAHNSHRYHGEDG